MYQNILVPLDGSPLAEAAVERATALASKFGGTLTLLRVVPPASLRFVQLGSPEDVELMKQTHKKDLETADSYLKGMAGSLSQQGYTIETKRVEGVPVADHIVEVANEIDADTIVMSTHGRSGMGRLLFGSVAENVLRQVDIPVLLVPARNVSDKTDN